MILFIGGSLPHCMLGYTPPQDQRQAPPGPEAGTPRDQRQAHTPNPRPRGRHPPPGPELGNPRDQRQVPSPGLETGTPQPGPEASTRLDQAPCPRSRPPGSRPSPPKGSACWEVRATSGRYASYWNEILILSLNFADNLIYEPFYCVRYIIVHFIAEGMAGPEVRGGEELPGQTAAPLGDEALLGQLPARERGIPENLPGEADMIHRILRGKTTYVASA